MSESDFQALKDSIENIGVQMPIVIFEGQVIDGWNRFLAAGDLSMPCPSIAFDESIDPVDFVKAMNDARRHITGSQRAIAIVAIRAWKPVGQPKKKSEPGSEYSQTVLAKEAGVSVKTIQHAQAAQTAGLSDKVKNGEMTVKQAANVAKGKPAKAKPKAKPAAQPEKPADTPEDDGPSAAEIAASKAAEQADRDLINKLLEEDDKLAVAVAECKRLAAENDVLQQRVNGLMNEKSEIVKLLNSRNRQIAKLEAAAKGVA